FAVNTRTHAPTRCVSLHNGRNLLVADHVGCEAAPSCRPFILDADFLGWIALEFRMGLACFPHAPCSVGVRHSQEGVFAFSPLPSLHKFTHYLGQDCSVHVRSLSGQTPYLPRIDPPACVVGLFPPSFDRKHFEELERVRSYTIYRPRGLKTAGLKDE